MDQVKNIVVMPNDKATPERSLLATVVLLAINDACSVPPKPNSDKDTPAGLRISRDAFTAMRFLFDTRVSGLDAYAEWLDFDVGHFRMKMRSLMADNGPLVLQGFDSMQRRNFRYNYGMWLKAKDMVNATEDSEEGDDE